MSGPDRPLRALIVDDEPLARRRVRRLLAQVEGVEVVAEASGAARAREVLDAQENAGEPVDIVFLDVQMPGTSGLDLVREVGPEAMPVTVFVTAHDQHALDAFDAAAADYLLKPYDDERFERALARACRAARLRDAAPLPASGGAEPAYAERIAVEQRGRAMFVPVGDIDYIASSGPYAELHVGEEVHVIRETMQALEDTLDPDRFARVHRSTIVRLGAVRAVLTAPGGSYAVSLHDGTELSVSRSRRASLVERLAGRTE